MVIIYLIIDKINNKKLFVGHSSKNKDELF
jgi:hypothetical protein